MDACVRFNVVADLLGTVDLGIVRIRVNVIHALLQTKYTPTRTTAVAPYPCSRHAQPSRPTLSRKVSCRNSSHIALMAHAGSCKELATYKDIVHTDIPLEANALLVYCGRVMELSATALAETSQSTDTYTPDLLARTVTLLTSFLLTTFLSTSSIFVDGAERGLSLGYMIFVSVCYSIEALRLVESGADDETRATDFKVVRSMRASSLDTPIATYSQFEVLEAWKTLAAAHLRAPCLADQPATEQLAEYLQLLMRVTASIVVAVEPAQVSPYYVEEDEETVINAGEIPHVGIYRIDIPSRTGGAAYTQLDQKQVMVTAKYVTEIYVIYATTMAAPYSYAVNQVDIVPVLPETCDEFFMRAMGIGGSVVPKGIFSAWAVQFRKEIETLSVGYTTKKRKKKRKKGSKSTQSPGLSTAAMSAAATIRTAVTNATIDPGTHVCYNYNHMLVQCDDPGRIVKSTMSTLAQKVCGEPTTVENLLSEDSGIFVDEAQRALCFLYVANKKFREMGAGEGFDLVKNASTVGYSGVFTDFMHGVALAPDITRGGARANVRMPARVRAKFMSNHLGTYQVGEGWFQPPIFGSNSAIDEARVGVDHVFPQKDLVYPPDANGHPVTHYSTTPKIVVYGNNRIYLALFGRLLRIGSIYETLAAWYLVVVHYTNCMFSNMASVDAVNLIASMDMAVKCIRNLPPAISTQNSSIAAYVKRFFKEYGVSDVSGATTRILPKTNKRFVVPGRKP